MPKVGKVDLEAIRCNVGWLASQLCRHRAGRPPRHQRGQDTKLPILTGHRHTFANAPFFVTLFSLFHHFTLSFASLSRSFSLSTFFPNPISLFRHSFAFSPFYSCHCSCRSSLSRLRSSFQFFSSFLVVSRYCLQQSR